MDRLSTVVDIDQPPSVVYGFLTDDENKPLWLSNFVRQERIKGSDGKVGSVSRQIFKQNGRQISLMEEITQARESEILEGRFHHDRMELKIRNELTAKGSQKTQLRVTFEYWPKTWLANIGYWLSRKTIFRRHRRDIENLKTAVEALGDIN